MFSNQDIDLAAIPCIEQAQQHRLSPNFLISNLVAGAMFYGIIALLIMIVRYQPFWPLPDDVAAFFALAIGLVFAALTLSMTYHLLADRLYRYSAREQDVSCSSGLIFHATRCQPILRIQHIEIKRGPIERLFNLASLHIFSAGGDFQSLVIPGLETETANKLHEFILSHKDLKQNV